MFNQNALPHEFYHRPTLTVARELLGCVLVRHVEGQRLTGRIVETEAYIGQTDLACHARAGLTKRTAVMFGPPGHAYVYLTYGMHWLLNAVTEEEGFPGAVLIRALEPLTGLDIIAANRPGRAQREWTSGPAKLTQALAIDGQHNGVSLTGADLYIQANDALDGKLSAGATIKTGPRIGLGTVPEPWFSKPWRLWVAENPYVSKPR